MRRARLYVYVSGWIAASLMFASPQANAFDCLPSAEAVKQQDPAAWPSWTLRAPGFDGKKCWYASTRATAHDHQRLPAPEPVVVISEPREPEPEVTGSATESERLGRAGATFFCSNKNIAFADVTMGEHV